MENKKEMKPREWWITSLEENNADNVHVIEYSALAEEKARSAKLVHLLHQYFEIDQESADWYKDLSDWKNRVKLLLQRIDSE